MHSPQTHFSIPTNLASLNSACLSIQQTGLCRQPSASFLLMSPRHLCCIRHYRS